MQSIAVVGKGLFGMAAARHLAKSGWDTTVVGPDEPVAGAAFAGPHGAHFDEARIMVARGDRAEIDLTAMAIVGILELQAATGRELLVQSGSLEILRRGHEPEMVDGIIDAGVGAEILEAAAPQGYYNPRAYLAAAAGDLASSGGRMIKESVAAVRHNAGGITLDLRDGATVTADRVVLAAGAWCNQLLRRPLALRLKREHVLFAKLEAAVAESISMRPAVVRGRTGRVEDVYTLPPLRYPDDSWYLKLGANTLHDQAVSWHDIDSWYRAGDSDAARDDLALAFGEVFPDVPVVGFHTERCVITYTPHGRPYIDELGDGVLVAAAGNGHGASWAEGAGQLVAALAGDVAWDGMDRDPFRSIYADEDPEWMRPLLMRDRTP